MLHTTNADIDTTRLRQHIEQVAAHRRHERALALPPLQSVAAAGSSASGWRQRLRRVPLLGTTLYWARERWWRMRAPGLSPAQRLRAAPVLGDLAAWGLALVTLPRWRAELRDQVATQQAQLQELRNQQMRLQQEVQALRSASIRPPVPGARQPSGTSRPDVNSR